MKELEHLNRLSAVKSSKAIRFLSPAVFPGCHCPMRMAALTAAGIEGLSSLLVGMPECTTHVRLFNPKPEGKNGEMRWVYVLEPNEVVFGCREGIMAALKKMDRAGAKAILLIATCVPELIGEDMEALIHEIQPELRASVTSVMLGQFKDFSYPPGYWKTMEALGALMKNQQTNPLQINVLGRGPKEKNIPAPELLPELERQGLSLRYVAPGAALTDLQKAPDGALNLVLSPYAKPLAARMEREFGVPYISLHSRFSVADIDDAYAEIAQRFEFDWKDAFEEERNKALAMEKQAIQRLKGLRYVLSWGNGLPIALAGYLAKLGMEPLLLSLEEFYPEDKLHAKALLTAGQNPFICRAANAKADYSIIEKLSPDLCFAQLPPQISSIPNVADMNRLYGKAGYGLTLELLKKILDALDEAEMKKGGNAYGTASI